MTFPTVTARNNSNVNTAGTSHVVDLPTGIVSGNLLIVWFGTNTSITSVTATGWSDLGIDNVSAGNRSSVFLYKVASGSEGSTVTFTTDASVRSAHISLCISGGSGTPQKAVAATGNSDQPNPPNITPSGGVADYLFIAAMLQSISNSVFNYPTNYSNGTSQTATGCLIATAERQLNASSEDPAQFFISNNATWVAQTLVIASASTATTLTADTGVFTETGVAVTFKATHAAAAGSFIETAVAAILKTKLAPATGVFVLTGRDATLFPTTILSAAGGSFTLSGVAATLKTKMTEATGVFTLTGRSAGIRMPVNTGSFTLSGQPVFFHISEAASAGVFTTTGSPAVLTTSLRYDGPGLFFIHWGDVQGVVTRGIIKDGYRRMRVRTGQHTFFTREAKKW